MFYVCVYVRVGRKKVKGYVVYNEDQKVTMLQLSNGSLIYLETAKVIIINVL